MICAGTSSRTAKECQLRQLRDLRFSNAHKFVRNLQVSVSGSAEIRQPSLVQVTARCPRQVQGFTTTYCPGDSFFCGLTQKRASLNLAIAQVLFTRESKMTMGYASAKDMSPGSPRFPHLGSQKFSPDCGSPPRGEGPQASS